MSGPHKAVVPPQCVPGPEVPCLDFTAVYADLDAGALSIAGPTAADLTPYRDTVELAKSKDIDLKIVVLDRGFAPATSYRDIATRVQEHTGGTVLVYGPGGFGSSSDELSRVQLENAEDDASILHPEVGSRQLLENLDHTQPDWTVMTVLFLLVIAAGGVVAVRRMLAAAVAR